jgi:hypothetical protein
MKLFFKNPANPLIMLIMVHTLIGQAFAQEPIKFDPVQAEQFLNSPAPAPQPAPAPAVQPAPAAAPKPAPAAPKPAPAAASQPVPVAQPVPPPAPVVPVEEKITYYEDFLDDIEELAKSVMPEKKRLDSLKAIASAETPAPKDEYEKQADYEKRAADFEKAKQQKMQSLEEEYKERTKKPMGKIKQGIIGKDDFQPAWAGMLNKDASNIKEYGERSAKILGKISEMKLKIFHVSELLGNLNFSQSEIKPITMRWQQKNLLYISRLERAIELMQDYSVQEQAKVLTTDKKKVAMALGAYNAEKEIFDISISDSASQAVVPFDFSGAIKMPPDQARETNKQTDNFTVRVDYINYPFIINGVNTFPGTKKIHVYYKDKELQSKGNFADVQRLSKNNSYVHWKVHADSIISGKLVSKKLDSAYAMDLEGVDYADDDDKSVKGSKAASDASSSGDSFWTTRNKIRIAAFAVSALCLGLGISKDGDVSDNKKAANALREQALGIKSIYGEDSEQYRSAAAAHGTSKDKVSSSESSRNAFYAGAAIFGIAGAATFFF